MKKLTIRRIGVGSFAKYLGVASALLALIAGIFAALGGTVAVIQINGWTIFAQLGATLGVWIFALVIYPALAFAAGWLYGALVSLIINVFLAGSSGIELEVEESALVK